MTVSDGFCTRFRAWLGMGLARRRPLTEVERQVARRAVQDRRRLQSKILDLQAENGRLAATVAEQELTIRKMDIEATAAKYEVDLLGLVHERDRKRVQADLASSAQQIATAQFKARVQDAPG